MKKFLTAAILAAALIFNAVPQFECDLIDVNRQSGKTKTYHAKFIARGMTVMQYEG